MARNGFFNIAVILVVGLFLAVLLLPRGAFAQDADTGSGPYGQRGPAAGTGVTEYGLYHDQMHANAGQNGTGRVGYPMLSTGHSSHHANMPGTMTGPMTGTGAAMHEGMMASGMGQMMGQMMGREMGHGTDAAAEHQQHMAAGTCPLAAENAAEHAAACPYQPSATTGE